MENSAVLMAILTQIAMLMPIIVVWAIGIILASARWKRHPRVSQFALIAFVVMIVTRVPASVLNIWLPITMENSGWAMTRISLILGAIGIVSKGIEAVAWAMVLWAIFGWRAQRKRENSFPPAFGNETREPSATSGFIQG